MIIFKIILPIMFFALGNSNAMECTPNSDSTPPHSLHQQIYPPVIISSRHHELIHSIKKCVESKHPDFLIYFSFEFKDNKEKSVCYMYLPPSLALSGLLGHCILPFIDSDVNQFYSPPHLCLSAMNIVEVNYCSEFENDFIDNLKKAELNNLFTDSQVAKWNKRYLGNFRTPEELFNFTFHEKRLKGFIIGENHLHNEARYWLIKHLKILVKDYNVDYLYLELFPQQLQSALDHYLICEENLMPLDLANHCDLLYQWTQKNRGHTKYHYKSVLLQAKKAGIKKIIAIDDVTYSAFPDLNKPKYIADRCLLVNQLFNEKYNPEKNSLTLGGLYHAMDYETVEVEWIVAGLGEISGLPIINLANGNPHGEISFPETSQTPDLISKNI